MKKFLAILLVAAMCLSMSGCVVVRSVTKSLLKDVVSDVLSEENSVSTENVPEMPEVEPEVDEETEELLDGLEFYTFPEGIHLMMEEGMEISESEGFTVYASDNNAMFAAVKEDSAVFESAGLDIDDYTLEEYAEIVQDGNNMEQPFEEDIVGNLSITYTSNQNGTDFFYYATVKEGTDCFWVVTFACFEEDKDTYLPEFQVWGASIVTD